MNDKTITVNDTPLDKTYPRKNYELQQEIMKSHLVVSQFSINHTTSLKDFAIRNKTMALISDVSVIVDAEKYSGSRYQGWETFQLVHPLFICESVTNKEFEWSRQMLEHGARIFHEPEMILEKLSNV